MLWTSLLELKALLEVDECDHSEDKKLLFIMERASQWIEELLGRPSCTLKVRTEFYGGTGCQRMLLRHRPVYPLPLPRVFVDEAGWNGAPSGSFDPATTELTYGDGGSNGAGFAVRWDQEDGTSRSAVLIRMNGLWPRPAVRQQGLLAPFMGDSEGNVKVIYTAGWTAENMPASLRLACELLVGRLRYILPVAQEISSDSYEEHSIGIVTSEKNKLLALVRPLVLPYRNWKW